MRLSSSKNAISRLDIQPVLGSTLPDVADFLHAHAHAHRDRASSSEGPLREDVPSTQRRLRWLLLENPLTTTASHHGLCIRNASGVIVGLLLSFPSAFRVGDRRLVGLGSGAYFVEPQAWTSGFYLFKKHLRVPGYPLFFATTCNARSGAVWQALGGCAVPNSDTEYIFPFRLDVLLPAFLDKRTTSTVAAAVARVLGRCANPVVPRVARKPATLRTEPSRDWEKLAELFRRHRAADVITTDRSAGFLQWRYGENASNHPFDIRTFRNERGDEGWFSLGTVTRGRRRQIRGCVLLDAVWPRERMSFCDILPAILQVAASTADAVYVQPRLGVDYRECSRWLIPWRLAAPRSFAINGKGGTPLAVSSLDLVAADGDGAS